MKIGVYYYPEQWPREQWERDFDNMAAMGLQIVHMGEFAWFQMEPSPGRIRLDWLEECIESAAERGMQVILCTPTAAPPNWLAQNYPDIVMLDAFGRPARLGARRHGSPTSQIYRDATRRIVTAMAERFGQHHAVVGWQIDNEYSSPGTIGGGFGQNDHTHEAFRDWIRRRYGDLQGVNRAWGTQFWTTHYTDWEQIMLPHNRWDPQYLNPHQILDASRFWSWAWADYNRLQAEILKKYVGQRFITTNFMPLHPDTNPADFANDLTLYSWDSYPVHGLGKFPADETYRIGDPTQIGFTHDYMLSYNGRLGLMELQPGQVNWSGQPAMVYPGAVRLWIWTAFAHGAEFVTTYRYRQPLWGIELFHHGLVGTDGVTPTPGGKQFAQVVKEMRSIDLSRIPPVDLNADAADAVGLLFDFEQLWYFKTLPQARHWHQDSFVQMWYTALMSLGVNVRILHPDRPWPNGLKAIIAPGVQMIDHGLVGRLEAFARGGGHLLLTCRSGLMNRNGQLWEGSTAKPILHMIGATINGYDCLPDDRRGQIEFGGKSYAWYVWGDLLHARPGTEVLGRYHDPLHNGTPAITSMRLENGSVIYCGVYPEQPLVDAVTRRLVERAGLATKSLPPRTQLLWRGPYQIFLNYRDVQVEAPAPAETNFIVGQRRVPPAGVAVWEISE